MDYATARRALVAGACGSVMDWSLGWLSGGLVVRLCDGRESVVMGDVLITL